MKISIIIPVFNEQKTVEEVIKKVLNLPLEKEIIVVDDGSTDGTREILEQLKVKSEKLKVMFHKKNSGKGSAIRTALSEVSGDIVCIQDADLEYNTDEIKRLVGGFQNQEFGAVYGSRFLQQNPNIYKKYYLGNKIITFFINKNNKIITNWINLNSLLLFIKNNNHCTIKYITPTCKPLTAKICEAPAEA